MAEPPYARDDLADVAAGIAVEAHADLIADDRSRHAGRVYELEGLTAVSGQDIAAALAEALGRPVRYQTAPLAGVRAALTAGGLQLYQASHTISILSNVNAGMLAQRDGDLLALLAAPPRSVLDLITRELKASR